MFADCAAIYIRSGKGGDGHVSFRRELFVAAGGPNGGDGGKGGDVVFAVDDGLNTLSEFRNTRKFCAEDGFSGGKNNCSGRDGQDLVIKVPEGTVVKESESGKVIADMSHGNRREVILRGGRGGKGNQHYATPTMQVPKYAQPGQPAKELNVTLELKVIADVGLVGFPNVGKSTLLSRVTNAKPKIANYHFTTLSPNIGVVQRYGDTFVMADIPGLIEGASKGAGLGHNFLRHVERVRLIVHIVDISGIEGRDPYQDYLQINKELADYDEKLSEVPQMVCVNKLDLLQDEKAIQKFEKKIKDILERHKRKKWYTLLTKVSLIHFGLLMIGIYSIPAIYLVMKEGMLGGNTYTTNSINFSMILAMLFIVISIVLAKCRSILLPPVSFMIGEQVEEIKKRENLFSKIFWGVIVAFVVSFIVAKLV